MPHAVYGQAMSDQPAPTPFPEAAAYFEGDARTNRERMLAGDWYVSDDPDNHAISARADRLCAQYAVAWVEDRDRCGEILSQIFGSVGEDVCVKPPIAVDYGENTTIGRGTFVNFDFTVLDVAPVTIGEYCQFGPHVQILTPVHPLEPSPRRAGLESADPIVIGNNVWLGGGVIVCPGVTIGDNCVIGAGAVVTKDIPASSLAVGSPARVIRTLDDSTFRPRR